MRWIKFMYDKGGEFTPRLGLEFGPAERGEGNLAVYQTEPKTGFRTFKAAKMHDVKAAVNPWQTEVYANRLARLRAPLWEPQDWAFLVKFVLCGIVTGMAIRELVMWP